MSSDPAAARFAAPRAPAIGDLAAIGVRLDAAAPQEILAWALAAYRGRIALSCSFGGPGGLVLLDMAHRIDPAVTVYYLDTDLLFAQTYALVETIRARYGIEPIAVRSSHSVDEQAREAGPELWAREPDRCCDMRKVQPQRKFLRGYDAWITGVRRDQSPTRAATPVVAWDDEFCVAKISPLAHWTEREVGAYIAAYGIPTNPLHAAGFASIGCLPCTRAIAPGEDQRAGRWSDFTKLECGLHGRTLPAVLAPK